jgi:hypothetical protein
MLLIIEHYPRVSVLYIQDRNAMLLSKKFTISYNDQKQIEKVKDSLRKLMANG